MTDWQNSPGWTTYLRVSDEDKQTPERSFAMQRQRIQEQLLTPSNLAFKHEYQDMLTGTSPNRKDYQQMLGDAEAGRFSHLGLYRADRFGRNAVEGLQAATKLISLGIKIRVAHMPSLQPETPDGFFMFLLQMGLAQREVDVLRERTRDGMEAKMRAGGWPYKAPDGYVNKERQVKSNKYERWVELEPDFNPVIRTAWDLLLTGRYTLAQICEELAAQGYTRASGRPWAWQDPQTKRRMRASNRLHKIFHNPFYAGWVVSERFGIKLGAIKGQWEPTITTEEYEKGLQVLHQNDAEKSRVKKHLYLLRNLLWVKVNHKTYKLYGSTPSGRSKSYAYYVTQAKPNGKKLHLPCETVDAHIPAWLRGITVAPEKITAIRAIYQNQVEMVTQNGNEDKLAQLQHKLTQLQGEEARLGRLYITGKLNEETYDQLRGEWQEKMRHTETNLKEMQQDTTQSLNSLDVALVLMTKLADLYERLEKKGQATLLQILVKRIIVNPVGEIIAYDLNSPFQYLQTLVDPPHNNGVPGSEHVREGAHRYKHSFNHPYTANITRRKKSLTSCQALFGFKGGNSRS